MPDSSGSTDPYDSDEEGGFISGIFNYCDRWCERCPFTLRCRVYAIDEIQPADEEAEEDIEDQNFWDAFYEIADQNAALPGEDAEDHLNEDLQDEELEDSPVMDASERQEIEKEREQRAKDAQERGGRFTQSAEAYAWGVHAFMEARPELDKGNEEKLGEALASSAIHPAEARGQVVLLADTLEVILWYQFFIPAKVRRAFSSRVSEAAEGDLLGDLPRDSDGSAKVALIAMDRSLAAWGVARDLLPAHAEAAQDFIVRLDRLRQTFEKQFPQARAFVRPGLDE